MRTLVLSGAVALIVSSPLSAAAQAVAQVPAVKGAGEVPKASAVKSHSPSRPAARHSPRARPTRAATGPLAAIDRANAGALSGPARGAFVNAALFYDYEPGRLYRIDASPRFLTTIALKPGEKLIAKAAGDTVRWVLGETVQGTGETAQVIILVKPVRGDLRTNVVLTTDQRIYHLEAVSHEAPTYTSVISWNYPLDQIREAQAAAAKARALEAERQAQLVATAVPVDHLNFGYRVEHPKQRRGPRWEPARVFDDGAKTYIQFPADLKTSEAPPLFLIGPKNTAELVNYRVRGTYYVVDRLIDIAELRLGEKPQTIVRITRTGARG